MATKKERLELLESQQRAAAFFTEGVVSRIKRLEEHTEASRQATAEAVAIEMGSLSADLTSVSDTTQLAVSRIVARIEALERRESYGRDALCEAQAAVQIAVAGSGSCDYGDESGHFRACPARYGVDEGGVHYKGGQMIAGPCKFNCEQDPTGVAEETTTRVDPTQNPPDSKVERMGTLMARGSVGFDTNPNEYMDPEAPREDPEQDRDAARDELAAFAGLPAKRLNAQIKAANRRPLRLPRFDVNTRADSNPPPSSLGPEWVLSRCRCGSAVQDDCVCCPACYTPQGQGFGINCFEEHGCGINRDEEARHVVHEFHGPPRDGVNLVDLDEYRAHAIGLIPYAWEMIRVAAGRKNGAAVLFWARLWCSLLLIRDLGDDDEDTRRDLMQKALTGDLGILAESLYG